MRRRRFMSGNGIPDNQIWYTSSDGNIVDVYTRPSIGAVTADYGLGSVVLSNQYYDKGIIKTLGPVTQIGEYAFGDKTSLVSITLPRQVAVIYDSAFYGCTSLSQIDLKNITSIGSYAFEKCTSLTSVTIPDSVTLIGYGAFYNCSSLTSVYCYATTPPTLNGTDVFDNNAANRKIYVPAGSVEAYKSATYWSEYADAIEGYNF